MNTLSLDLKSNVWKPDATGPWQGRCDRKGIYVMSHPYEPAQQNTVCRITRSVTLPDGIPNGGSVWLRFYCSDGYIGCDRTNLEVGYEAENDPDCRYRRILVNGQTVWEADVAGLNPPSPERFYTCDITPHLNRSDVELTFQVIDTRPTIRPRRSPPRCGARSTSGRAPPRWRCRLRCSALPSTSCWM